MVIGFGLAAARRLLLGETNRRRHTDGLPSTATGDDGPDTAHWSSEIPTPRGSAAHVPDGRGCSGGTELSATAIHWSRSVWVNSSHGGIPGS
ncbi:hypothetical protein GCM10010270_21240 [Streptomyces violaceus]|nr:hypothetical protein GCM10010270_21240 [Streptomyces janthinus]